MAFQTPSSNSCMRSTTKREKNFCPNLSRAETKALCNVINIALILIGVNLLTHVGVNDSEPITLLTAFELTAYPFL